MVTELMTLKDLKVELVDGDRGDNYPKNSELKEEGYCLFLNASNVTSRGFNFSTKEFIDREKDLILRKGKLNENDVVMTTRGTVGNVAHFNSEVPFRNVRINSGMIILRAESSMVVPSYLLLALQSNYLKRQIELLISGSVQKQLPVTAINKLKIPYIDKGKQEEVVSEISIISNKLSNNKALISRLEEYSQLLFHKWFIEFNFPNGRGKPYKDSGGEMVEINGKLIPKGWDYANLRSIIENDKNGDWGNSEPSLGNKKDFYCVRGTDIPQLREGRIEGTPIRYTSDQKKISLGHNDIVLEISHASNPGRTFLVKNTLLKRLDKPLYFSNFSKAIKPKEGYAGFLYALLRKLHRQGVLLRYTASSNIKNISVEALARNYKIALPDEKTLNKFEEMLEILIDKIISLGHENELLEETRDLLIHKLIK